MCTKLGRHAGQLRSDKNVLWDFSDDCGYSEVSPLLKEVGFKAPVLVLASFRSAALQGPEFDFLSPWLSRFSFLKKLSLSREFEHSWI